MGPGPFRGALRARARGFEGRARPRSAVLGSHPLFAGPPHKTSLQYFMHDNKWQTAIWLPQGAHALEHVHMAIQKTHWARKPLLQRISRDSSPPPRPWSMERPSFCNFPCFSHYFSNAFHGQMMGIPDFSSRCHVPLQTCAQGRLQLFKIRIA